MNCTNIFLIFLFFLLIAVYGNIREWAGPFVNIFVTCFHACLYHMLLGDWLTTGKHLTKNASYFLVMFTLQMNEYLKNMQNPNIWLWIIIKFY